MPSDFSLRVSVFVMRADRSPDYVSTDMYIDRPALRERGKTYHPTYECYMSVDFGHLVTEVILVPDRDREDLVDIYER
jgi:hypothetical protein